MSVHAGSDPSPAGFFVGFVFASLSSLESAAAARAQLEHASVSYGAASEKHARAISSMQAKLDAAAAELRSAIFATVAHDAIRHVSNDVFTHLHALDMQFHLERQTGALARAIDRGSRYVRHPRPRHPIA